MVSIFNEGRKDTLLVNPFFQRNDLDEVVERVSFD
jgi:hypothetical protein